MSISLGDILLYQYPNECRNHLIQVGDHGDGNGPQIVVWNVSNITEPVVSTLLSDTTLIAQVTFSQYFTILENYINQQAQAKQYNDALSLISYLNSSNTTWAAEAKIFNSWRDGVWNAAIACENAVIAGTQQLPVSFSAFLATLPVLNWNGQ